MASVIPAAGIVVSADRSDVVADKTGSSTNPTLLVSLVGLLNDSSACKNSASVKPVVVSSAGTNDGASTTSMTSTGKLAVVTASLLVRLSWAVAVMPSVKSSPEFGAGVMLRPASSSPVRT